ncbi:MAG: translation initiation factor [Verrucomicrobiota bacterium]
MNQGKVPTDGGSGLAQNPFAKLSASGLPTGPQSPPAAAPKIEAAPARNRGRVDVRRETGGRAGTTVTVADGFVGIGLPEKEQLAKRIRAACGAGGTVKEGRIEIQGDHREMVAQVLTEAGFRPVMAGG